MPIPRKPPEISNYQFLCALLYMIENGCKWRALPKKYGKWHTIYTRFNRWSKNGMIKRFFEKMQELNIIDVRTDTLCIDSTSIKVHPDAAGARKSNGEQSIGQLIYDTNNIKTCSVTIQCSLCYLICTLICGAVSGLICKCLTTKTYRNFKRSL